MFCDQNEGMVGGNLSPAQIESITKKRVLGILKDGGMFVKYGNKKVDAKIINSLALKKNDDKFRKLMTKLRVKEVKNGAMYPDLKIIPRHNFEEGERMSLNNLLKSGEHKNKKEVSLYSKKINKAYQPKDYQKYENDSDDEVNYRYNKKYNNSDVDTSVYDTIIQSQKSNINKLKQDYINVKNVKKVYNKKGKNIGTRSHVIMEPKPVINNVLNPDEKNYEKNIYIQANRLNDDPFNHHVLPVVQDKIERVQSYNNIAPKDKIINALPQPDRINYDPLYPFTLPAKFISKGYGKRKNGKQRGGRYEKEMEYERSVIVDMYRELLHQLHDMNILKRNVGNKHIKNIKNIYSQMPKFPHSIYTSYTKKQVDEFMKPIKERAFIDSEKYRDIGVQNSMLLGQQYNNNYEEEQNNYNNKIDKLEEVKNVTLEHVKDNKKRLLDQIDEIRQMMRDYGMNEEDIEHTVPSHIPIPPPMPTSSTIPKPPPMPLKVSDKVSKIKDKLTDFKDSMDKGKKPLLNNEIIKRYQLREQILQENPDISAEDLLKELSRRRGKNTDYFVKNEYVKKNSHLADDIIKKGKERADLIEEIINDNPGISDTELLKELSKRQGKKYNYFVKEKLNDVDNVFKSAILRKKIENELINKNNNLEPEKLHNDIAKVLNKDIVNNMDQIEKNIKTVKADDVLYGKVNKDINNLVVDDNVDNYDDVDMPPLEPIKKIKKIKKMVEKVKKNKTPQEIEERERGELKRLKERVNKGFVLAPPQRGRLNNLQQKYDKIDKISTRLDISDDDDDDLEEEEEVVTTKQFEDIKKEGNNPKKRIQKIPSPIKKQPIGKKGSRKAKKLTKGSQIAKKKTIVKKKK